MPKLTMTIADLAASLRGMPRDAVVMIDTPAGMRELRTVRGMNAMRCEDGIVVERGGPRAGDPKAGYVVVLCPAPEN